MIGARTWFEGFDRWPFLKIEFFVVLARSLLTEIDGITLKQRSFVLVVFARSLLTEFDGMTCSFSFVRTWLIELFLPFSLFARSLLIEF